MTESVPNDIPDDAPLQILSTDANQHRGPGAFYDSETGTYRAFSLPDGDPYWDGYRQAHAQGLTGAGQTMAVIDSGMLTDHPLIRSRLTHSESFLPGENAEDSIGHGTAVTLLALLSAPETNLVNLKVIGSDGQGTVGALVRALEWVAQAPAQMTVNMSVGIYSKRWLILDCRRMPGMSGCGAGCRGRSHARHCRRQQGRQDVLPGHGCHSPP